MKNFAYTQLTIIPLKFLYRHNVEFPQDIERNSADDELAKKNKRDAEEVQKLYHKCEASRIKYDGARKSGKGDMMEYLP